MKESEKSLFTEAEELTAVVSEIRRVCSPVRVYLYNQRIDSKSAMSSFKLCVIAEVEDKFAAERDIYLNADSDIPFDILIYTPGEWDGLTSRAETFASKIVKTGAVVYDG